MKDKRCFNCCKIKPLECFSKDKQKIDGYRSECNNCRYNKEIIEDGFKRCRGKHGCGEIKPISEFYLRKDNKRHKIICNECVKKFNTKYTVENKSNILIARKIYINKNLEKNTTLNSYETVLNKKCSYCQEIKNSKDFCKDKYQKDGLNNICKICSCIKNKKWQENNKDKKIESDRKSKLKNKENNNKKFNFKYNNNITFKIGQNLRNRLRASLKNNQKSGSAVKDLGCSVKELKTHLEKQFYTNKETGEIMSWENYGLYGWHIDHIIPISNFNLENREEFLKACHYTNLQPLWAKENLQKGDKI